MSPSAQAALSSWSIDPMLALGLIVLAILYLRGWRVLHRVTPDRFPVWRWWAFFSGIATLWLAVASPLDTFSGLLLSAHMVQHLLLLSVVPPLILLGEPFLPLLRGLPRTFAHDGCGPFLTWPALRRFGRALTHPIVGWLAMMASLCGWHVPAAFELALRSPDWHKVEHACFFGTALLFWWPVIRPFPSRPHWPLWAIPIYLFAADVVNTALCSILSFSEHVLYPAYAGAPRLFGMSALSDQASAGVIMWVPGSLAFLIPATVLAIQYLSSGSRLVRPVGSAVGFAVPPSGGQRDKHRQSRLKAELQTVGAPGYAPLRARQQTFDLLAIPVIGRFLRARWGRRLMQTVLLLIVVAVMADGFFGPQTGSSNLAGVLPWNYWRALTLIALLAAGNLFCMACPFMLPRELGRRLGLTPRAWPRALRSKWLAATLLVIFFWATEAFRLWDRPIWTAWLVLSYFLAAFVIDAFYRGASFCKYVCPVGQFQFINSLVSPLEVKVRAPDVCVSCRTHDCLRGNDHQRGCETDLHLPDKVGNLDCTFCLDCVRACPHDNIGVLAVVPGADLSGDPQRSSLGRFSGRIDVAALALLLVFAAFTSAAAMAGPVMEWRDRLTSQLGLASPLLFITILFAAALVLVPASVMGPVILLGRTAAKVATPTRELLCRFSLALVPLGAAMWAGHFLFHLLPSYGAVWPVLQQAVGNSGFHFLGYPAWVTTGMQINADTILVLQTLLLDAGLLLTLYLGWRIARDCAPHGRYALRLFSPWAGVALALYASGIWIFLQPMQMRGMMESLR
jgi:cytochrome c oxidase assembly factor CtaG/ferredoxin